MANFPMSFPAAWDNDNTTYINGDRSSLAINKSGKMQLSGDVKDAALNLLYYALKEWEICNCIELILNDSLIINYEKDISIRFKKERPEFWDALEIEFSRIKKLRAFW